MSGIVLTFPILPSKVEAWYRERLYELHDINLAGYEKFSHPIPLPQNQELLFEWSLNSSNPKKSEGTSLDRDR